MAAIERLRTRMGEGLAIPACPLALNAQRRARAEPEIDALRTLKLVREKAAALKIGEIVNVEGNRARDGSNNAVGRRVTFADGRNVFTAPEGAQ